MRPPAEWTETRVLVVRHKDHDLDCQNRPSPRSTPTKFASNAEPGSRLPRRAEALWLRSLRVMAANEIDEYLAGLDDARRESLEQLRRTIREILPEAEEGLSYGVPVFRVDGRPVAGFSAAAKHLSYVPHSGTITTRHAADLAGYSTSKGAFKFKIGEPPPKELVATLIAARLAELAH